MRERAIVKDVVQEQEKAVPVALGQEAVQEAVQEVVQEVQEVVQEAVQEAVRPRALAGNQVMLRFLVTQRLMTQL